MRRVIFAAILFLLFAPQHEAQAVGLPPGTQIQLTATGDYDNIYNEHHNAVAVPVTLTVLRTAGTRVDWLPPVGEISSGSDVYIPLKVYNTGNAPDTFDLSAQSVNGWTVKFIYDENNDGTHQNTEQWEITDTDNVVTDGYCPCFAKVSIPSEATDSDTVIVTSASRYSPQLGTGSAECTVPAPGMMGSRITASAIPLAPYVGQTVTITAQLDPAKQEPIDISIVDPVAGVTSSSYTTGADGSLQVTFVPDHVGAYNIQLDFAGDDKYSASSANIAVDVQDKIETSITLTSTPDNPSIGSTLTVNGTLLPVQVATVDLTCTKPSGSSTQYHITTNQSGQFSWNTNTVESGAWYIVASYAGSESQKTTSSNLSIQVTTPIPETHNISFTTGASVSPAVVESAGTTQCNASATDSGGHQVSYHWSDGNIGGEFSPSADVKQPSYKAPANTSGSDITVTLSCTAMCANDNQISAASSANLTVHTVDLTPPNVTSILPANGSSCVALDSAMVIQFSKAMNKSVTQAALSFSPALTNPSYIWSTDSRTLTVNHQGFAAGTTYNCSVLTSAVDTVGIPIDQVYTWTFSTATGANFSPNQATALVGRAFITPSIVLGSVQLSSVSLAISVPESISVDSTRMNENLTCIEQGSAVTLMTSDWDGAGRLITISAHLAAGATPGAEIVKAIHMTAPTSIGSVQLLLGECSALNMRFKLPEPGDFNLDGNVNTTDAAMFIDAWNRWHGQSAPLFDASTDGPFDLAPHTSNVWPSWTATGDHLININDANAFIDCWLGSHSSQQSASVPAVSTRACASRTSTISAGNQITVSIDSANNGVFETSVQLPAGATFNAALDTSCGNLKNVDPGKSVGEMFFTEYDRRSRTIKLAGNVYGDPPYKVAVIRLGR
ncbi:MAG: Ig-like domain-containing protein [Armatimonadota bacterium]|nr:Ig-like domain-containing protein [bacterium]